MKIAGRLQTRSWDDKQTNKKRYMTEVVAYEFAIPEKERVTVSTTGAEVSDDDIPF